MLSGINPFKLRNKTKYEKLQMITEQDIQMMPMFSEPATSLLKGLLNRNVSLFSSALPSLAVKAPWQSVRGYK